MSVEDILHRYSSKDTEPSETDNIEDVGGYGLLRGIRDRCPTVEFRKRDDRVMAIPYALIEQFLYSPSEGITLYAIGREIRIVGRHLNDRSVKPMSLFTALTRHRISWVQEQTRVSAMKGSDSVMVESISW